MKRGDIRWYTFQLPDKRRPVLILTRDEVIDRLNEIVIVPATPHDPQFGISSSGGNSAARRRLDRASRSRRGACVQLYHHK